MLVKEIIDTQGKGCVPGFHGIAGLHVVIHDRTDMVLTISTFIRIRAMREIACIAKILQLLIEEVRSRRIGSNSKYCVGHALLVHRSDQLRPPGCGPRTVIPVDLQLVLVLGKTLIRVIETRPSRVAAIAARAAAGKELDEVPVQRGRKLADRSGGEPVIYTKIYTVGMQTTQVLSGCIDVGDHATDAGNVVAVLRIIAIAVLQDLSGPDLLDGIRQEYLVVVHGEVQSRCPGRAVDETDTL